MKYFSLAGQKFTSWLDWINDKFTSYRLVLYFLLVLAGWAVVGSFFNKVPYSWHQILVSGLWIAAICWLANKLISKFLDIPANKESDLITGLILALILTPPSTAKDFAVVTGASIAAIASKYIITNSRSHIFNPAASGAFIAGQFFNKYPSWWVGTKWLTPIVILGGVLILRKMKRFTMALVFLAAYILYLIYGTSSGGNTHYLWLELVSTQLLFFAVIMLTEPLTSPTSLKWCLPYAVVVAIGYSATQLKLSPEAALLVGNLFTFIVSRNRRYLLNFVGKTQEAQGIYSYAFTMPKTFSFQPGQYMEWTVAHNKTDSRGNRRYLTIASSPTEPGLMFTVKHPNPASAFKQRLDELKPGDAVLASRLAGSFTLPKDSTKKIALLAGGIGVTPYRSMVKYLMDTNQKRDVALIYSANRPDEISYRKLFDNSAAAGLKTSYVTDGRLDELKLSQLLPDYMERRFYISGPYAFVSSMQSALIKLGIGSGEIVTDYFPGYGN